MSSGGAAARAGARLLALVLGVLAAACSVACCPAAAGIPWPPPPPTPDPGFIAALSSQVQHLHFRYGPLHVAPGSNLILLGPVTIEKPAYDGYVVGFRPNLTLADGTVPGIDVVHLHHAVWLNASATDATDGGAARFFASGEEKTQLELPAGYGYPVKGTDVWALNYMLHNLTPDPQVVYITYDVDYLPASSPLAAKITPVRPIWMDVENGEAYPVFDVHEGAGGASGQWTFPAEAQDPYGGGAAKNAWTVDRGGTLVWAGGHLHPGGLHVNLTLARGGRSVELFDSQAHYWDPGGPISWDMAMTVTPPDWRVGVKPGDRLSIEATYDTAHASWYESMGIMMLWEAQEPGGPDPFGSPPPTAGQITHGHLPEADNHGGEAVAGALDPATLPDGQTLGSDVGIAGFQYLPGTLGLPGDFGDPPVVHTGQALSFYNFDASEQIFHTITACKDPCNGATGISYPLANGPIDFDSGELGYGPNGLTAASNKYTWTVPANLPPGTYTYFCRIHPFMRGAFRVLPG